MSKPGPTRSQRDLADVVEMILDKGIVINADIAVTVGETELIGIELRAAIASFETAAEYGLQFPSGTDMRRVREASGRDPLEGGVDLGIEASRRGRTPPGNRPNPRAPVSEGAPLVGGEGDADEESDEAEADAEEDADADEAETAEAAADAEGADDDAD